MKSSMMKIAACLAVLAAGSAQAFSPRFELGTRAMESFSSCGSSCSMMRRQDYYVHMYSYMNIMYTHKADSATCALPSAKVRDHNENGPTATTREGSTASGEAAAAGCLDDLTSITLAITSDSSDIKTATNTTPPRIELGDSATEPFSSYMRKADSATCALPSTKAWDNHEGEIPVT
jgi:hypothetical protein